MTKAHLQSLNHRELIQLAIKLRVLPSNFLEIRQIYIERDQRRSPAAEQAQFRAEQKNIMAPDAKREAGRQLLDSGECEGLVDEVYETLAEQRSESQNDLTLPLRGSLHKFELELDRASGLAEPLPGDYFSDSLGLTRNKLHFILRDMEWGVIFWQLSTDIHNIIKHEEQSAGPRNGQVEIEESSLTIALHESPIMPKFGRQCNLGSFQGNYLRDYYQGISHSGISTQALSSKRIETNSYSFSINSGEYKRYVFLRNDHNYYWAELYHYNGEYDHRVLLARSSIIFKPRLLEFPSTPKACTEAAAELYQLSNSIPEGIPLHSTIFPSVDIA